MRLLTEYLSTQISSNTAYSSFPEEADENLDNIVKFLKSQEFNEIQKTIDGSFYLSDALELFDNVNIKSYLRYEVKTGTRLAFSNGGTITSTNPLFTIYKANSSSNNIDIYNENFGMDKEGRYLTKRYKNSREFSNRVNKYFNW